MIVYYNIIVKQHGFLIFNAVIGRSCQRKILLMIWYVIMSIYIIFDELTIAIGWCLLQ